MPHAEGAGVALQYDERGDGAPLLVVHGMASDATAWAPALDELAVASERKTFLDAQSADLNEAIQLAAKIPPARAGSVEVRPVRELAP